MQPRRRKSRTITFSMPPRMAEQVNEVLQEESMSRSELLRQALRLYLEGRELRLQERLQGLRFSQPEPIAVKKETTMSEEIALVAPAFDTSESSERPDLNLLSNTTTVYGIDCTSSPTRRKPIVVVECRLAGDVLRVVEQPWRYFETFDKFEAFLAAPPPRGSQQWVAAADFPFGLPIRFLENMKWPMEWTDYIDTQVAPLCRQGWRDLLDEYKRDRPAGDREHRRRTDEITGAISPQKQYGVPVGMMLYEGAPRLRRAGVMIPGLQQGCPERVVVEGYPGVAVRNFLGERVSYKSDVPRKQTPAKLSARRAILDALLERSVELYGISVQGIEDHDVLTTDGTGDHLDSLLCALQAAWAWSRGGPDFFVSPICRTEGWIADPMTQGATYGY